MKMSKALRFICGNLDILLPLLCAIPLIFCLRIFTEPQGCDLEQAIVLSCISISFGLRQYKIEDDRIFKDLFSDFNSKYDNKFNDKLNEIKNKCRDSNYCLDNEEINLVIDYLNFCSEQYLWHTKGRIDKKVWKAWKCGMAHYILDVSQIRRIADEERLSSVGESYYGFLDELLQNNVLGVR